MPPQAPYGPVDSRIVSAESRAANRHGAFNRECGWALGPRPRTDAANATSVLTRTMHVTPAEVKRVQERSNGGAGDLLPSRCLFHY